MPSMVESLNNLESIPRYLVSKVKSLTDTEPVHLYSALAETIQKIDKPETPQPPPRSEYYLEQWHNLLSGTLSSLDRQALKYLCWESNVVEVPEFCRHLVNNAGTLGAKAILGLVSTMHRNWTTNAHAAPVTYFTVAEMNRYTGRNRTIAKWKSNVQMLLGKNAAATFANNVLVASLLPVKHASDIWAISEDSAFMRYSVVNAFEQTLPMIARKSEIKAYILNELFPWTGWVTNQDGFRHMVGKLILHTDANAYSDELRDKVISHRFLGDPRLPVNKDKWLGVDDEARKRFISWLSREDIKFFFDNVLGGRDPHGRREFWLRYVDRVVTSRPFLIPTSALPLRQARRKINFGNLTSSVNKAVFVLDFGVIIAVEFSEVGKIYLYKREEFSRFIPDFWTDAAINETRFKNQGIPNERRIRHQAVKNIVYVDWRRDASSVLAQHGIRP